MRFEYASRSSFGGIKITMSSAAIFVCRLKVNDKLLGIVIDNNLTWSRHVDNVCKKITSNL